MGAKRLILGPSFRVLLDRMTEEILGSRSSRPLDQMLVIVPDVPVARFVESHLSRVFNRPLLNVQVMPLWLMPRRLLTRNVSAPAPSHRALLRLACRYVLSEAAIRNAAAHRLEQLAGIEESLLRTFYELLEAGLQDPSILTEYVESSSPMSEISKTTLTLYASWLEALQSRGLWPNQLIVSQLRLEVTADRMHVYGFTHIPGAWHDFVDMLVEANAEMDVLVYYPGQSQAKKNHVIGYEFAMQQVEERMGGMSIEEIDSPQHPNSVAVAIRRVFASTANQNRREPETLFSDVIQLMSAPGESGEVEATAREIMRLVREPPYDEKPEAIAVLARDLDRYVPVIRRVFSERDIPVSWLKPLPASHNPAVRWVQLILALPGRHYKRDDIIGIFLSPFLSIPDTSSVEAFSGLEQRLLELCITTFDDDTWIGRTDPEVDSSWRDAVEAFVREIRELSNAGTGSEFSQRLLGFLERWVRHDLLEDNAVLGPWLRQLEWLRLVDDSDLCSGERIGVRLLQLVTDDLGRLPLVQPAPRGRGVVIGSVAEAMGMSFDVVFLLGVNRGQFPKRVREDPLLPDAERSRLFNVLGYPLTIRANEHAHEKLLFVLTALAATKRFIVLYRHSSYAGSPESESLFVPLFVGERATEQVRVIPCEREKELQSAALEGRPPLTIQEAMTLLAREPREGNRSAESLALFSGDIFWEFLRNAQKAAAVRNRSSVSAYDLAVAGHAATVRTSLHSAAAWRDLEKCPYRFFLARMLRIPRLTLPEALWSLSVLDEGTIVHKFFELLFQEGVPARGEEAEVIGKAWEGAVEWYHIAHPEADLPAVIDYQIGLIERWLIPVAEREIALVQTEITEHGFPSRILVEYAPTHASLTSTVHETNRSVTIPLSVRIDRLDLDVDGSDHVRRSRLIDYKVRSQEKSADRDAENLQLYLYAEALVLLGSVRPDAVYVEFFSGHDPEKTKALSITADDPVLNDLYREKVRLLLTHLQGHSIPLFLTPDRGHECVWCDYRWYCKRYDFVLTRKSDEASDVFFAELKDLNKQLRGIHKEMMTVRYR